MPKKDNNKTYIKESIIPNIGKGLFARIPIKKNSIIAEFKGIIKDSSESITNKRSTVLFTDGYKLDCYKDDIASFSNDPIKYPSNKRKLIEALNSAEPFYQLYEKTRVNASIKTNDELHRAFLIAADDIEENEEIFCHYCFNYWFNQEVNRGFLDDEEIGRNGFPEQIYGYPSFESYLKLVYPKYIHFTVTPEICGDIVTIRFSDGTSIMMRMTNYRKFNLFKELFNKLEIM